jgi:hypothetical protein
MRSLLVASMLLLVAAAPASGYQRLAVPKVDGMTLGGGRLYVKSGATLIAVAPDSLQRRTITLPRTPDMLDYVTVSSRGIAVGVFPRRSYYRAHGGRWHEVADHYAETQIDGSVVSILHENRYEEKRHTLDLIDLRTGRTRHQKIYAYRAVGISVSGPYFSYATNFAVQDALKLYVRSVRTARVVYQLKVGDASAWRMLPVGRLLVVQPAHDFTYRVSLASPSAPRLRRIRELGLTSADIAVAGGEIALMRGDPRALGDVALMGFDGRLRSVTPLLSGLDEVEYDGHTLAFKVGDCAFVGPPPAPGAPLEPIDTTGCLRS